ncbi:uncharacterized protein LOC119089996 [Pollicipes pollicipes]|uniref:uncharacterized protein LOC119089996 n=1 Tax=Pollicipes pollicipes TaxID=41117 RepID=UPI001884EA46|nr:uncharacterized protein LOC119089996 [Pollicipes pollicipes]
MFAAIRGRNRSESPTRFSEISLRRYKKNVRSKKNSAAAMSADEEAVVGHRSVSMSTLSLNGANSTKSDQQKPSISQLATVEAKCARRLLSASCHGASHLALQQGVRGYA